MVCTRYLGGLGHSFLCVPVIIALGVLAPAHGHVDKVGDGVGASTNVGNHSGLESVSHQTVDIVSEALAAWLSGHDGHGHVACHEVLQLDVDQVAEGIAELISELLRAHHFNLGDDGHEVVLTENKVNSLSLRVLRTLACFVCIRLPSLGQSCPRVDRVRRDQR